MNRHPARAAGLILAVIALVGIGFGLLLLTEEGASAAVTLLALGGGVFLLLAFIPDPRLRSRLCLMFAAGLAIRALVALIVYHWNPYFFSLDQCGYFHRGAEIALQWRRTGDWPSLSWLAAGPGNHFSEMWAVLAYFVGPSELALRMCTSVLGAYGAIRTYQFAAEIFGERRGQWAGWLAALWPSLVIWAAQGLREPLIILMWCEAGIGVVRICRGRAWRGIFGLAAGLYGLSLLRPYAAVWAAGAAAAALLLTSARRASAVRMLAAGLAGLVLLVAGLGFLGAGMLAHADLSRIAMLREGFQGGGSSFGASADISSLSGAIAYLPIGLAYFLLAPFPWQAGSALQLSTMIEQPVWYLLFALSVSGVISAVRRHGVEGLIPAAFIVPIALFCGLVISNIGTGYRDRAQLAPFVFLYVAEAIVARRARSATPAGPAPAVPRLAPTPSIRSLQAAANE